MAAALKASKVPVPEELSELVSSFSRKLNEGRAHGGTSGFGGRGLERLATDRERVLLTQQTSFGDQLSEDPFGEGKPKTALGIEVSVGKPSDTSETRDASGGPLLIEAHASNTQRLEAARAAGADTEKLEQALARINAMRAARHAGGVSGHAAAAAAELGRIKARDPNAPIYHTVVPINDFPQRVRWTVTNKDTLAAIVRKTGVAITSKGQFYERARNPGPGEPPKLALLIESDNQSSVEQAASEVKRLLLEGMRSDADSTSSSSRPLMITAGR